MLTKNWKCLAVLCALTLSLTAVQAQAATIQVDIENSTSTTTPTQAGWTAWAIDKPFTSGAAQTIGPEAFSLGADGFTATLSNSGVASGIGIGSNDMNADGSALNDLSLGGVFSRDELVFTFTGLDAGTYTLTTYHRWGLVGTQDGTYPTSIIDSLGTNAGASVTQLFSDDLENGPAGIANFTLVSDGSPMSLTWNRSGTGADNIYFNGFELSSAAIPEPSTLVLAGMGLLGLLACGRRRRG